MTPSERRDPDEPELPGEPSDSDVDTAFAQIVAGWDSEGESGWQTPGRAPDAAGGASAPAGSADSGAAADLSGPADPADSADSTPTDALPRINPEDLDLEVPAPAPPAAAAAVFDEDEDHFVPPDPPPLPRPQPATIGAIALVILGVILLAVPNMIGFSEQYGLPLGLLSITGAIVWLVARLRQGPPTDSGWDDGAQL